MRVEVALGGLIPQDGLVSVRNGPVLGLPSRQRA